MTTCQNRQKEIHERKVTTVWNQQREPTEPFLTTNRISQCVITKRGTCMLIDAAISGDRNVIKREAEKILKYKDLTTEVQSSGM